MGFPTVWRIRSLTEWRALYAMVCMTGCVMRLL